VKFGARGKRLTLTLLSIFSMTLTLQARARVFFQLHPSSNDPQRILSLKHERADKNMRGRNRNPKALAYGLLTKERRSTKIWACKNRY